MIQTLRLNGGKGTFSLQSDGSVLLRVEYQLGFGVQIPPGAIIVVEELFKTDALNDERQLELARLAEKWRTPT